MKKIINFFDQSRLVELAAQIFSCSPAALRESLDKSADPNALELAKELGIKFSQVDLSNVFITIRHGSNCSLKDLKNYGLINLTQTLQTETNLRRFLRKNEIEINFESKHFLFRKDLYVMNEQFGAPSESLECALGQLYTRLFSHEGQLEGFCNCKNSEIESYSCIREAPEVLLRIDHILGHLINDEYYLQRQWAKERYPFYIIEADIKFLDISIRAMDIGNLCEDFPFFLETYLLDGVLEANLNPYAVFLFILLCQNYRIQSKKSIKTTYVAILKGAKIPFSDLRIISQSNLN